MKNKPTKRDIQIVEHFVKKTTKTMMNEASYDSNSKEYKLKFLQDTFKALYEYSKNKQGNLNPDFIIASLQKVIKQMELYKNVNH